MNEIMNFRIFNRVRTYFLIIVAGFIFLLSSPAISQEDESWKGVPQLKLFGFVDAFYAYDFGKPTTAYRQTYFYNHNRHNEFNLNLGVLGFELNHEKYRAKISLQVGTYTFDISRDEQSALKNVFEAYAGVSLNRKNNLWLDGGIFLSHLGVESPISIDNLTLTRSIAIENLPYYLAGARLTYKPNDVLQLLGMVTNGWQRIMRVPGNSLPGYGTQVLVTPNNNLKLAWGTFIGTEDPDSTRRMMYFNDFYAVIQLSKKIGLSAGFDIGLMQRSKGSSEYDNWYTYTLIAKYKLSDKWSTALRGEYYNDSKGVIVTLDDSLYAFRTSGFSLNFDYTPVSQLACRLEGRWLQGMDEIYMKDDMPTTGNFFIVASIAVQFEKLLL